MKESKIKKVAITLSTTINDEEFLDTMSDMTEAFFWEVFCKKDALKNFAKFTGKHL